MTLSRHILNILQRVAPQGLFETTLKSELHVALGEAPGHLAFQEAVMQLRDLGWIDKSPDPLTRDIKWTVTESGKGK